MVPWDTKQQFETAGNRTLGCLVFSRIKTLQSFHTLFFFSIGRFTYDLYPCIAYIRVSNCAAVTNGSYLLLLSTKSQNVTSTFPGLVWRQLENFSIWCKAHEKWKKMNKDWFSRISTMKRPYVLHTDTHIHTFFCRHRYRLTISLLLLRILNTGLYICLGTLPFSHFFTIQYIVIQFFWA